MNHEVVVPLLDDFVSGVLPRDEAIRVSEHVASCAECREVADTLRSVRHEAGRLGTSLFTGHPAAEDLVRYATADEMLSTEALARIGEHARACPTCEHEVEVTRRAAASPAAGLRAALGRLAVPGAWSPWPALAPALAALVVLLVYPAYLGVIQFPEARHRVDQGRAELEAARRREVEGSRAREEAEERLRALAGWGGGVPLLVLPGAHRGREPEVAAVRPKPGQPFQPVVIEHDLGDRGAWPAERRIEIVLRRLPEGAEVWTHEATVAEIWDARSESVSLLLPAPVLAPGDYRLELLAAPRAEPLYSARFQVDPPSDPPLKLKLNDR